MTARVMRLRWEYCEIRRMIVLLVAVDVMDDLVLG